VSDETLNIVLCNGATLPRELNKLPDKKIVELDYDRSDINTKVDIGLPKFVSHVNYLPNNIKDLLEIAAYIYAADRSFSRGETDRVEYDTWSRSFHFIVKVRDEAFWNSKKTTKALNDVLSFVSGDREYTFSFQPGRSTDVNDMFDREDFKILKKKDTMLTLFSGGLDSLAGVLETLATTKREICLVSHISRHPIISSTQRSLVVQLNKEFNGRCKHYAFICNLKKHSRRVEESQRTRSFLFTSIAFALSNTFDVNEIFYFENGITSINFSERPDLFNARASRTTHPKTIRLLQTFFRLFNKDFEIKHPFLFETKTDVLQKFKALNKEDYIRSAVSCSKTFQRLGNSTHCGGCSQCIDRKIAAYSAELDRFDDGLGLYSVDFVKDNISDLDIKKTLIDYVRLAMSFKNMNVDNFYSQKLTELSELDDYIPGVSEQDRVNKVFELCNRHGAQVEQALVRMRNKYAMPFTRNFEKNSLLDIIRTEEHFKEPMERLIKEVSTKLTKAVPLAFQKHLPVDENDFNDKIEAIISSEKINYEREFPHIRYSLAKTVPDHSINTYDLLIESKYPRNKKSISALTDEITSDIVKYGIESYVLFVIFDPERLISNDSKFKRDIELSKRVSVTIIR